MLRINSAGVICHIPSTESTETCGSKELLKVCHDSPLKSSKAATGSLAKKDFGQGSFMKGRSAPRSILKTMNHTARASFDNHSTSTTGSESGQSHSFSGPKLEDPEDSTTQEDQSSQATTISTSARTSTRTRTSRISFSQIQIREYPIIVGDNPSIMTGTPVTIDWEPVEEATFDFQDYEDTRAPPRSMVELRMPAKHRDAILKNQGFSLADRNRGRKMANLVKNRRKRTDETVHLAKVLETLEEWKRATKNATWGRRTKQKERQLLKPYKAPQKGT